MDGLLRQLNVSTLLYCYALTLAPKRRFFRDEELCKQRRCFPRLQQQRKLIANRTKIRSANVLEYEPLTPKRREANGRCRQRCHSIKIKTLNETIKNLKNTQSQCF